MEGNPNEKHKRGGHGGGGEAAKSTSAGADTAATTDTAAAKKDVHDHAAASDTSDNISDYIRTWFECIQDFGGMGGENQGCCC